MKSEFSIFSLKVTFRFSSCRLLVFSLYDCFLVEGISVNNKCQLRNKCYSLHFVEKEGYDNN